MPWFLNQPCLCGLLPCRSFSPSAALLVWLLCLTVSLILWLLEFHAIWFSGAYGCLLIFDWLLSSFWLCEERRVSSYASTLAGTPKALLLSSFYFHFKFCFLSCYNLFPYHTRTIGPQPPYQNQFSCQWSFHILFSLLKCLRSLSIFSNLWLIGCG